jgi:ribosome biogenesis GTPase
MKGYDEEEAFHQKDRKEGKKWRRQIQATDRSQFKKSDQNKIKPLSPEVSDALKGKVLSITRESIQVAHGDLLYHCSLKGSLKQDHLLSKNLLTVGDFVLFVPSSSDQGTIHFIEPRYSVLSRTDISGHKEQLIAANIDQLVIVLSIKDPPIKPSLIDRYLIAAEKGKLKPLLILNKCDLIDDESRPWILETLIPTYRALGYPVVLTSTYTLEGIDELKQRLQHQTSVVSGQSGVGKSSLLNSAFGLCLKTEEITIKTQKGSHTTTTTTLLPLKEGGYCIDTPGIRSFSLWQLEEADLKLHFRDLFSLPCRFKNCTHTQEPGCALKLALENQTTSKMRYESYLTLREGLSSPSRPTWD